ncbi:uncharacterized protein LOC113795444 [Dermatophagoides pteronyssinus]|uniref:uncharacterized protein LOC113795444 n=1 Tax=Dermatophagoides pteronyssinus TaxID=6956 RepID=UPI003F67ADE4
MTMNDNGNDESILKLFQEYKKFCHNKINDQNSTKDEKISFMNKIINNLFDQNEQLIELIIETKQNAEIKSMEMNRFMLETATKTIDIGHALSSYELEMKHFTQRKLPQYLNLITLLDDQSNCLNDFEKENIHLRMENKLLNDNIESKNIELEQYKNIVANLIDHNTTNENSLAIQQSTTVSESSLIERFNGRKLAEQKMTIDSMICASIIDELINTVENEQEETNYSDDSTTTTSDATTIDQWFEYSETEFENAWCNILMNFDNNNNLYSYKMNDCRILSLMSIMLNEIEHKNTVINVMKNESCHNRKNFLELHYRFIERGLQMLKFLIKLIDLSQENDEFKSNLPMIQTMANNIENEIKEIVHYEETSITI